MREPVTIEDLRHAARRRLPRVLFDYLDGGSYDEVTLRANRSDLEKLRFRPRVLVDVSRRSLATSLFGQPLSLPIVLSPIGALGLFARHGEVAAARAAERCGVPFCLSTGGIGSIEEVRAARATPFWFQLYLGRDRGHARSLIERAAAAGCSALVFTVDTQVGAQRDRDLRNGYTGSRVRLSNLWDMAMHPDWLVDVLARQAFALRFGNMPGGRRNFGRVLGRSTGGLDPSVSWKEVDWVRSLWKGPLIVKGILTPEDARLAADHGADGVSVSNHGGRQLDGAPSSISALPAIAEAVGDRSVVLLDGGIRRGQDVLKAIALGARACLIGRAYGYGLAAAGERGVERALRILEAEMSATLALLGRGRLSELDRGVLI